MRLNELLIYRDLKEGKLLYELDRINKEPEKTGFYDWIYHLVDFSVSHGFSGNLWQMYITYLFVENENVYSRACEIKGNIEGSLNDLALHDFAIFLEAFQMDFKDLQDHYPTKELFRFLDFEETKESGNIYNKRIKERIEILCKELNKAKDSQEFKDSVTSFYQDFGVGTFGLHKAFRVEKNEKEQVKIVPITKTAHVNLEDLVGYKEAKEKLIQNTLAFVEGKKANNCLLFGDAGTGKSSSIKAILNKYYDKGLRIIEIYKHQFQDINEVIRLIKNRNYKFILYMDDLSFEEFEIEYKYLKAVIEGGLEKKPDNVLIYATSNRRHLIKETFKDKKDYDEELHTNDTVQEKLSLVARFGVTIYFGRPEKKEYQEIVKELAKRSKLEISEEELLQEANKWELYHGGMSGRSAQQFIDYMLGVNTPG